MITILGVVLTAACALITVALMGTLRRLAEIRLRLTGVTDGSPTADVLQIPRNTSFPEEVTSELPFADLGVIALLSDDCPDCRAVATSLQELRPQMAVHVALLGDDRGEIRRLLPSAASFLSRRAVEKLRGRYGINRTPVLIFHQGGTVVTSGHSKGIASIEQIGDLLQLATVEVARPEKVHHVEM